MRIAAAIDKLRAAVLNGGMGHALLSVENDILALSFGKENLLGDFAGRTKGLVDETRGLGFHDYLSDVYQEFYPGVFEDAGE